MNTRRRYPRYVYNQKTHILHDHHGNNERCHIERMRHRMDWSRKDLDQSIRMGMPIRACTFCIGSALWATAEE